MSTIDRITEYLSLGGLFNPELMDHQKVRQLLIDCRADLTTTREQLELRITALSIMTPWVDELEKQLKVAREALDKIRDPRKRHSEPDKYTELGCVMNIADEALKKLDTMAGNG